MLIAITGLHGSGKSYFSDNVPEKYGYKVIHKNELISSIFNNLNTWPDKVKEAYQSDPTILIEKIIKCLPKDKDVFLDAVHSPVEWDIIKKLKPDSQLMVMVTPKEVRKLRRQENDTKDNRRIEHWHSKNDNGSTNCLLTKASWSLNGNASLESNEKSFKDFLNYIDKKQNIENQVKKEDLKTVNEIDER